MDILTTGPPIAHQQYPIPLKYQKFVGEEIQHLKSSGCISKRLSPWVTAVETIPNNPNPLNPGKQQLSLVIDYCLLNKSISATHNGNKVISYYPFPNITDIIAKLQKCKIYPSLILRSGYHHIGLTLEAKPKTAFDHSESVYYQVYSTTSCQKCCQV